jgi:hypothetical protein
MKTGPESYLKSCPFKSSTSSQVPADLEGAYHGLLQAVKQGGIMRLQMGKIVESRE